MYKSILSFFLVICILPLYSQDNQLLIPPTISGESIELTLAEGSHQFFEGINTPTLGINGNILGPTIILQKGEQIDFTVNNQIGETTTIHWHGMHVSAENDGGPHTKILNNTSWNPNFTVLDKAATYWYHPHLHQNTNNHVLRGMAGLIIVQDDDEASLPLPREYGVDDIPLVIQTKTFDDDKLIVLGTSAKDTEVLANATRNAFVNVPAQIVRFRLLNGASQRIFELGLTNNMSFFQIASDGGLLASAVELKRLRLSPGERAEILIDLSSVEGQEIAIKSYASELQRGYYGAAQIGMNAMMTIPNYNTNPLNGSDFDILKLIVDEPNGNGVSIIPNQLVAVTPYNSSAVNNIRQLLFTPKTFSPSNMVNGPFVIDGNSFDINTINQTINLNDVEIWEITNQSMIAHPFHIHDVQFYIISRNGVPVPANEQGRKDVVLVPPMFGTVKFIAKFEDFANNTIPYMYHCHMLTHEDDGMMGQFVVVDPLSTNNKIIDNVTIFPNPTTKYIYVKGDELIKIKIINSQGIVLFSQSSFKKEIKIDMERFSSGIYYLKTKTINGTSIHKIVKL
ncbi:MAG: multicopper oxidase domain-containing protein [Saprospiraceae bacterium]